MIISCADEKDVDSSFGQDLVSAAYAILSLEVWGPLDLFEGVLGTLKSLYRVYSRYIRIAWLRAHTRGPWFQPLSNVPGKGFEAHYTKMIITERVPHTLLLWN